MSKWELVTTNNQNENGWIKNLKKDGVIVEVGVHSILSEIVRNEMRAGDTYQEPGFKVLSYAEMMQEWRYEDEFVRGGWVKELQNE